MTTTDRMLSMSLSRWIFIRLSRTVCHHVPGIMSTAVPSAIDEQGTFVCALAFLEVESVQAQVTVLEFRSHNGLVSRGLIQNMCDFNFSSERKGQHGWAKISESYDICLPLKYSLMTSVVRNDTERLQMFTLFQRQSFCVSCCWRKMREISNITGETTDVWVPNRRQKFQWIQLQELQMLLWPMTTVTTYEEVPLTTTMTTVATSVSGSCIPSREIAQAEIKMTTTQPPASVEPMKESREVVSHCQTGKCHATTHHAPSASPDKQPVQPPPQLKNRAICHRHTLSWPYCKSRQPFLPVASQ